MEGEGRRDGGRIENGRVREGVSRGLGRRLSCPPSLELQELLTCTGINRRDRNA